MRIRPVSDGDALFRTLSGGLLEVQRRPVGILLAVQPDEGLGNVMRLDHLSDVVRAFFDVRPAGALAAASGYTLRPLTFRAMAAQRTRVFEQPDRLAPTVDTIDVGATFQVTGQVNERLWLRIERNGARRLHPDDGREAAVKPQRGEPYPHDHAP